MGVQSNATIALPSIDGSITMPSLAQLLLFLTVAASFPLLRWVLGKTIFHSFGQKYIGLAQHDEGTMAPPADLSDRLHRFKDTGFRAIIGILFTTQHLLCTVPYAWFYDTWQYFPEHCTKIPCREGITVAQQMVYLFELAYYIQDIPFIFFSERRPKDAWELLVHHIAAISLLCYSYWMGFTKAGLVVLLFHEPKDVVYFVLKMVRCLPNVPEYVTENIFLAHFAVWVGLSVAYGAIIIVKCGMFTGYRWAVVYGITPEPHGLILNGFLNLLFIMHIYWNYQFFKIAKKLLNKRKQQQLDKPATIGVKPQKTSIMEHQTRNEHCNKENRTHHDIQVFCTDFQSLQKRKVASSSATNFGIATNHRSLVSH